MNKAKYVLIVGLCTISLITGCNQQNEIVDVEEELNVVNEEVKMSESVEENITFNQYEVAGITDSQKFNDLFISIQEAVSSDSKALIADNVLYPLRVNNKDGHFEIIDKEEFINSYDEIITDKVKSALIDQTIEDLFVNYQGVMVGNGEIWFASLEDESQYGIITINQ
jgi:hypothetical protein